MPVIAQLVKCSLRSGVFPHKLRLVKALPIRKSGDALSSKNLRPIFNLIGFNKLFDKVVFNNVEDFLKNNNLISKCQLRFKANSSTRGAVTSFTNHSEFDK